MQWIGELKDIEILNTFHGKNNTLQSQQQSVLSAVSVGTELCVLCFFHWRKCKKILKRIKKEFYKKILVFIIFKSTKNQLIRR